MKKRAFRKFSFLRVEFIFILNNLSKIFFGFLEIKSEIRHFLNLKI